MGGALPQAERRSSALAALCVALSLLLLLIDDRVPQGGLRAAGALIFAPLDRVVLAADRLVGAWHENLELHRRVTELDLENVRLRGLAEENRSLRGSLSLPGYRPPRVAPAEVLALTGEPYPAAATLSVGRRQGVRVGDAVVTSDGLVGRVGEVYAALSRVVLLTDPDASVACEVESTGVQGVLRFSTTPRPRLLLTAVPFADTVRVGERLLTSGLSRRYRSGLPVGRVMRVGHGPDGLTQTIEVQPAARLSRLRFVFVVPGPDSLAASP